MTGADHPTADLGSRLERVAAGDRFADFCLWDYEPKSPPLGGVRSASLLFEMLRIVDASPTLVAAVRALREGLGAFHTVWCAKESRGAVSFEFYFYDYERQDRRVSVERVLALLAPFVPCALAVEYNVPYFMFSLDLDDSILHSRREIDHINLYVGNPGSTVSSGICYNVSATGRRLDNFYFFFRAEAERAAIRDKIYCSVHLAGHEPPIEELLWPRAREAEVIVVANKRSCDGLYFSRTSVDGLLAFLARSGFPAAFAAFVARYRDELAHMAYDVGYDYRYDTKLIVMKTAIYGLL